MIRGPRIAGVNTVLAVFIASLCALAVGVFLRFAGGFMPTSQQAIYAGVAFVVSGGITRLGLATFMKASPNTSWDMVARSGGLGAIGGVVTAEALVITYFALGADLRSEGDLWGPLVGFAFVGVALGAAGGFVSAPAFLFAREPTILDLFDRALFRFALILTPLAFLAAFYEAERASYGGVDGQLLLLLLAIGFGLMLVRDLRRRVWLRDLPGWTVVPAEEDEILPSYVARGREVLVEQASAGGGPFRAVVTTTRVALIDLAFARRVLVARVVVAVGAIALIGAFEPWVFVQRRERRMHEYRLPSEHPEVVEGIVDPLDLTMSRGYTCAHSGSDRALRCWGNEAGKVLGLEYGQWKPVVWQPGAGRAFAAEDGLCTLDTKEGPGQTRCWYASARGRGSEPSYTPGAPIGPADVIDLVHAESYTLALTAAGDVWGWGELDRLVLSGANIADVTGVKKLEGLKDIRQIAAGDRHACALDRGGDVYCWGHDYRGSVSGVATDGLEPRLLPPTKMAGLPVIDRIVVGSATSWAHADDGWHAWGAEGERGRGFLELATSTQPDLVRGSERTRDLVVTDRFTCALTDDRAVRCAAKPFDEGPRMRMDSLPPGSALAIAGSHGQLCALRGHREHDVMCWGPYK